MSNKDCVFCKIAAGEIPAKLLFEDEEFVAFRDTNPQAPLHLLVIPRHHYADIMEAADSDLLGRLLDTGRKVATTAGVAEDGFRLVINCRDNGGQTVPHLHLHVLAGRFMGWPPG